jgi:hypothetical protein
MPVARATPQRPPAPYPAVPVPVVPLVPGVRDLRHEAGYRLPLHAGQTYAGR